MVHQFKKSVFGAAACLGFLLMVIGGVSIAQEKTDTEKLYAEIVGDYAFEYEGLTTVFVVTLEEGKLKVGPEGEVPDTMQPVPDTEMTFLAYSPDGDEFQFKFARDDEGKITKCTVNVPAMGVEIEGVRIK